MDLTQRVRDAEHSATMQVKTAIGRLESEGVDVINMAPGSPDFDTPEHVVEAGKAALDAGHTRTTQTKGIPELRSLLAEKLETENGVETSPDRIVTTPGSKFALFASILATVEAGDEAVVLDPSWVSYSQMVTVAEGDLERVTLNPETGFTPEGVDFAASVDDDTEVLILNNPSNPTGAVFSREDLGVLRDLAVDHDVTVISDEIYEKLRYGVDVHSIGAMDGMAERTITVNGFSKSHAMTGWRLGYLSAPADLVDAVEKVQGHAVSCPTSFVQYGGVAALEGPTEPTESMRTQYETRLDAMLEELAAAGVSIPRPEGAFYTFVPVRDEDDVALCDRMLEEAHVAVAPGTAFGVPGYVRLSATTDVDRIRQGVRDIADYLGAA